MPLPLTHLALVPAQRPQSPQAFEDGVFAKWPRLLRASSPEAVQGLGRAAPCGTIRNRPTHVAWPGPARPADAEQQAPTLTVPQIGMQLERSVVGASSCCEKGL